MLPRQFVASLIISFALLIFIVWLIKRGKLDIAYCWVWLFIGIAAPFIVLNYGALQWVTRVIGAITPTTTLFLFGILILFLICLQLSIAVSPQRRQIKRLAQKLALLEEKS